MLLKRLACRYLKTPALWKFEVCIGLACPDINLVASGQNLGYLKLHTIVRVDLERVPIAVTIEPQSHAGRSFADIANCPVYNESINYIAFFMPLFR